MYDANITNQLREIVADKGITPFILKYSDGKTKKVRLGMSTSGELLEMKYRSKRRGYWYRGDDVVSFQELRNPRKRYRKDGVEGYIDDAKRWARYVRKNCHPSLWPELREEANKLTEENCQKMLADLKGQSSFEAWQKSREYSIPTISGAYKTLSLNSCLPRWMKEQVLREVKEAINNKKDYKKYWRHNYDYSLYITFNENGEGRATLSQEFKDCGNGHYWIMINYNHCIFSEDD